MDIGTDEEEVRALDRRWNEAYSKHERSELAEVLADNFVGFFADGRLATKVQLMGGDAPATVTFSEFDIRIFGSTAVTRGRILVEPPSGEPREQRFFRIYSKEAGRWSAVAVQVFPIV
jgi:hypothetical protein